MDACHTLRLQRVLRAPARFAPHPCASVARSFVSPPRRDMIGASSQRNVRCNATAPEDGPERAPGGPSLRSGFLRVSQKRGPHPRLRQGESVPTPLRGAGTDSPCRLRRQGLRGMKTPLRSRPVGSGLSVPPRQTKTRVTPAASVGPVATGAPTPETLSAALPGCPVCVMARSGLRPHRGMLP